MDTLKSPETMLEIVNAMMSAAKKLALDADLYEILDTVLFMAATLGAELSHKSSDREEFAREMGNVVTSTTLLMIVKNSN